MTFTVDQAVPLDRYGNANSPGLKTCLFDFVGMQEVRWNFWNIIAFWKTWPEAAKPVEQCECHGSMTPCIKKGLALEKWMQKWWKRDPSCIRVALNFTLNHSGCLCASALNPTASHLWARAALKFRISLSLRHFKKKITSEGAAALNLQGEA